ELVAVRPGETAQVTIGGKGRAVVGRLVLSPPLPNYDWGSKLIALVQNRPDLVAPKMEQSPTDGVFFRLWNIYDASIAKYYLELHPDGSFQITDVLPGEYTLAVPINEPPANPSQETAWLRPGPGLGGITNSVVVPQPANDQIEPPLDLGQIMIPIQSPAAKQASAQAR